MQNVLVSEFEIKNFERPDKKTVFPGVSVDSVQLGAFTVTRMIFQPGWRWTDDLPALLGTDTCETPHPVWMVLSGRFVVRMDDGTEKEFGPGDLGSIPPGHDAWVKGDEPVHGIDIQVNGGGG